MTSSTLLKQAHVICNAGNTFGWEFNKQPNFSLKLNLLAPDRAVYLYLPWLSGCYGAVKAGDATKAVVSRTLENMGWMVGINT